MNLKYACLENVQTVNSVCHISPSEKKTFWPFFSLVVVILGWITSRFKSPLKLNMYTVCINESTVKLYLLYRLYNDFMLLSNINLQ